MSWLHGKRAARARKHKTDPKYSSELISRCMPDVLFFQRESGEKVYPKPNLPEDALAEAGPCPFTVTMIESENQHLEFIERLDPEKHEEWEPPPFQEPQVGVAKVEHQHQHPVFYKCGNRLVTGIILMAVVFMIQGNTVAQVSCAEHNASSWWP